jgi:hypothetical protein
MGNGYLIPSPSVCKGKGYVNRKIKHHVCYQEVVNEHDNQASFIK